MRIRQSLLTFVLCLHLLFVGGLSSYALSLPADKPYQFRELSASNGLKDILINVIYKDSLGYVWLGTGSALNRFDGAHLSILPVSGTDEKLKRINAIAETEGNRIWVGNGLGLWRVNKHSMQLDAMVPDRINMPVHALWHDGKGALYIGSDQGLFVYAEGLVEHYLMDENTLSAANHIKGIAPGTHGEIWLTTGQGLYCYHPDRHTVERPQVMTSEKVSYPFFRHVVRIKQRLYIGSMGQGLWCYDLTTGHLYRYVDVGSNQISSLSSDGERLLYVGTDGNGVHFIDVERGEIVRSLRYQSSGQNSQLRSNSVYSLLVDREGLVWVGYYQLGLDYTLYQNNLFDTYAYPPYLDTKNLTVRSLCIRGDEKLIGSRDGLFFINEKRGLFRAFTPPQLRSGMVFAILYYEGLYYIGTYGGGLYLLDPQTLQLRNFDSSQDDPFLHGHIFCLTTDHKQRLWMATSQGVYCYQHGKQLFHFTDVNSKLPEGNVYEIFFDSTHRGWFCTENGMALFDPSSEKVRTDIFPEGFVHKEKIRVVYETKNHQLFFCPDKGALFYSNLSMTSFQRLEPDTPLSGRDLMSLVEDEDRRLWIGTDNGLFSCDAHRHIAPYSFADGIQNPIFTLCKSAVDEEGTLWIGNVKGLLCLSRVKLIHPHDTAYRLRITNLCVDGRSSSLFPVSGSYQGVEVELQPSQNNLSFHFSNFSYSAPDYAIYEYQLEGKDEDWRTVTGSSEVSYYGLPTGDYRFRVRMVDRPETEAAVSLKIESYWWKWPVRMAMGLILVLCVAWWYYARKDSHVAVPLIEVESREPLVEEDEAEPEAALSAEKYRTLRLSDEECHKLVRKLERLMQKEKLYLSTDLKIADVAAKMDISAHTLSYLFNQHLQRNYYDYINDYRIDEFKRIIKTEGQGVYTLSALAERCGFSSRASFFRYFKKATGITPNEYIHQQKQE